MTKKITFDDEPEPILQELDEVKSKSHDDEDKRHKNFMKELLGIKELIMLQTIPKVAKNISEQNAFSPQKQQVGNLHEEPKEVIRENSFPQTQWKEVPSQNVKPVKKKWILKLIIGGVIDFILSTGLFLSLVYGANYSGILSFILTFIVFVIFAIAYTVLIYFIVRPSKDKTINQLDNNICPHCKSKLEKGKVQQNGEKITQQIFCSNPMCLYKNELNFSL